MIIDTAKLQRKRVFSVR